MVIDTFEDYTIFHSHLHAIVSDGLFRKNGTFYTLPTCEMKQLEGIFRSMILTMLKRKGKIADDLIQKLMTHRRTRTRAICYLAKFKGLLYEYHVASSFYLSSLMVCPFQVAEKEVA